MASSDFKTADVLDKAATLIERGWCQRALAKEGGVCAIGALNEAVTGDPRTVLYNPAYAALADVIGCGIGDIHVWNNDPERTQAEVAQAFRAAADKFRPLPTTSETWVKPDAYMADLESVEA